MQIFITVCNTVAFAHARGVIHRDLKGQNILLGDFGEALVLDWGLAKDDSGTARTATANATPASPVATSAPPDDPYATMPDQVLGTPSDMTPEQAAGDPYTTMPGQILGTPSYMSPEQAAGEVGRVDKRSDIYSLGAILYEILTGQPPFADQCSKHGENTIQALLRRIQEEQPTKPRQLLADVPAPLQSICLRALAKDPGSRYQDAQDLAREVQRWLADLPVEAHPDPWTVRAGRSARQHRTFITTLGVLLTATVVGLTVTTLLLDQEQRRTEAARAKAERNFQKAQEAVDRYFTQVSEDRLLNEPGMLPLRKELLASAREFYEDLAREQQQDPASREALGESQLKLARIVRTMGDRDRALTILEDAQALFAGLAKAHPGVDRFELGLCKAISTMATRPISSRAARRPPRLS